MDNTSVKAQAAQGLTKNKTSSKRKTTKVYPRTLIVFIILLVQVIVEIRYNGSYFDEAITILFIGVIVFNLKKMTAEDFFSIILFALALGIGLLSNAINNINPSIFSVLVDAITQCKFFAAYYALNYFCICHY